MRKTLLFTMLLLLQFTTSFGQNMSNISSEKKQKNLIFLSKGINIGYRAGLDNINNELLSGYYFDLIDIKRHRLITFDNDLCTSFNRISFNSTISYSTTLFSLSYSTDVFQSKNTIRVIPAVGLSSGINDLISIGLFYNHKFNSEVYYPKFALKLIIRPSFIKIISENPDNSVW